MGFGNTHGQAVVHVASGLVIALVTTLGLAALPGSAAGADNRPASTQRAVSRSPGGLAVDSIPVPQADPSARRAGATAQLDRTRVRPFGLVGVTWRAGSTPAGTSVAVRLHQGDGWTGWRDVPYEESEGPAPDEESGVRDGTAPLWTGGADGLAVRVTSDTGLAPADIEAVTVDPGADPGTVAKPLSALAKPPSGDSISRAPSFPRMPRIVSRKQWGADPSLTDSCDTPRYGRTAKMVFVHHTVNSNDYSARDTPAIVRAIYAYHTQGQHWCDVGYNALVDRFGNIYEGRRGGLRKPVRGAHAGDYNVGTVGVSLIGNFETSRPTARMKNALIRFIGWRLGTSYKPVRGSVRVNGARFARISGHRDAMSTACPGRYVYAQLPRIRARVARYLSNYHSALASRAARLGVQETGQVWKGERAFRGGFRTVFRNGWMFGRKGLGAHLLGGNVLERYRRAGGPAGVLGWPKSDVRSTPIAGVRVLLTQKGRMYARGHHWFKVIRGPIFRRYRALGFAGSDLGLPVTNVRGTRAGQRVRFQHGTITWYRETDRTRVRYS